MHSGREMKLIPNGNGNGNGVRGLVRQLEMKPNKPKTASAPSKVKDSHVGFHTADGEELRGTLAHLTRHIVVFELYNSATTLRLSEALDRFVIVFQDQTIYSGRVVVRGVVDAGTKIVCEAVLDESKWTDFNNALSLQREDGLKVEFKNLLVEWQKLYKVLPEFKIVVVDLHSFLSDLRSWLDQVEIVIHNTPETNRAEREGEMLLNLEPRTSSAIQSLTERFEDVLNRTEPDLIPAHHAFCRRLMHPITLCSPFMHRTFYKPLGYAGDYEMVNMMFRNPFEGDSLFAKMINHYALQLPPIVGHRNRIQYLGEKLQGESLRVMGRRRDARIFSMGCGPAQEVQRFLSDNELANRTHFTLADFNQETLKQTGAVLGGLKQKHSRRGSIQMLRQSIQQLLKAAGRNVEYPRCDQHDLIYCAGLFDYLTDQVCRQLMDVFYAMLAPGGLLIATNVDNHPARNQMECFLDWHLVHRDETKMRTLVPQNFDIQNIVTKRDTSAVNVFMEMRKPGCEN